MLVGQTPDLLLLSVRLPVRIERSYLSDCSSS